VEAAAEAVLPEQLSLPIRGERKRLLINA
jgi:hypothetical protein